MRFLHSGYKNTAIFSVFDKKQLLHNIVAVHTIIRILLVLLTNLGNDEVYYVNYALYPAWSYFDHPPMVGWFIYAGTWCLKLISVPFFVRLGAIIAGSLNLYLIYGLSKSIHNHKTGIIAVFLISSSFYAGIISGTFILPDTPLSFFWLCAIYSFVSWIQSNYTKSVYILSFGIFCGLALLSKYQAVFLWAGAMAFILFKEPKLLKNPFVYIAGIISILMFSPVIYWNLNSAETGINYHASRVGNGSLFPNFKNLPQEFFGQLFYNNPITVILIFTGLLVILRRKKTMSAVHHFLLWCGLPLIITTIIMSFYNKTLPHWSGPGYFSLTIIASLSLQVITWNKLKKWLWSSQIFYILILLLAFIQISYGILIPQPTNKKTGKNDFTTDLSIWDEAGHELENHLDKTTPLITHNWFPAAHLNYYYAMKNHVPLFVYGTPNKLHEYQRINNLQNPLTSGDNAYYITTSQHYSAQPLSLTQQFSSVSDSIAIPVFKHKKERMKMYVWRLDGLKNCLTLIELEKDK